MKNIIIVTGGTIDKNVLSHIMESNPHSYILGVDKGMETLMEMRIEPNMVMGDFDSANPDILEYYRKKDNIILLEPEKDLTDTHAAILKALDMVPERIILVGATGNRVDHMMANIHILKLCLEKKVEAYIIDCNNRIRMIDKQCKITKKEQYGKYISCIPFSDKVTGVNLIGFKYPLTDATMIKADSLGISNELREEEGLISIDTGYLLVMETKDL